MVRSSNRISVRWMPVNGLMHAAELVHHSEGVAFEPLCGGVEAHYTAPDDLGRRWCTLCMARVARLEAG
jgi:hypothetical protein